MGSIIAIIASLPGRIWNRYITLPINKGLMKSCGKNVSIGRNFIMAGGDNITIGDDCAIGPNCVFYAALAPITLGRAVMVSPNVTIITGEHRTDVIGEYMRNVPTEMKLPQNDKPVVIEDDVWIGSNVTILKGVTIGRGSIIHAGTVITKRVKPYTIYINDKTKISRFTDEEIQQHEKKLHEKYGVEYSEYHPKNDRLFS